MGTCSLSGSGCSILQCLWVKVASCIREPNAATGWFGVQISLRLWPKRAGDWTLSTGVSSGGRKVLARCVHESCLRGVAKQ